MPSEQADAVAAVYAFARKADDIADEGEWEGQRLAQLDHWETLLENPGANPIFVALFDSCRRYQLPLQLFRDLLIAFRQDVLTSRYQNLDQILSYCQYSANPIGRLVLRIAGQQSEENDLLSDKICTALQLTNFWQDLRSDMEKRDRVYLPLDSMKALGANEGMLTLPAASPQIRQCILEQVSIAEKLFEEGQPLVKKLKGRLSIEIALTLAGGRKILEKIKEQDYDTLLKRPKISRKDWFALAMGFKRVMV